MFYRNDFTFGGNNGFTDFKFILGYYTNFVNPLDLCGIAVPAGFRPNGLPFGITLLSTAFRDRAVSELASRFLSTP